MHNDSILHVGFGAVRCEVVSLAGVSQSIPHRPRSWLRWLVGGRLRPLDPMATSFRSKRRLSLPSWIAAVGVFSLVLDYSSHYAGSEARISCTAACKTNAKHDDCALHSSIADLARVKLFHFSPLCFYRQRIDSSVKVHSWSTLSVQYATTAAHSAYNTEGRQAHAVQTARALRVTVECEAPCAVKSVVGRDRFPPLPVLLSLTIKT